MSTPSVLSPSINDLPIEMLGKIMAYLPMSDQLNCRCVCKNWYDASYSPCVARNQRISIEKIQDLDCYRTTSRHYNVRVANIDKAILESEIDTSFWETHGDKIESLTLEAVNINHPAVAEILVRCENLKSLSLSGCEHSTQHDKSWREAIGDTALPTLTELSIIDIPIEAEDLIVALLKKTQSLRRLTIENLHFLGDDVENDESQPFTWDTLISAIEHNATSIMTLEIVYSYLTSDDLRDIVNAIGCQLTTLNLEGVYLDSTADDIKTGCIAISQKFINMKHIDFPYGMNIDGDTMDLILRGLPKLRRITFPSFTSFPAQILFLKHHHELTHVNLSYNWYMPRDYLTDAFASQDRPQMISLVLNDVSCVDDTLLGQICPKLPNLQELGIVGCNVGNDGLKIICRCNQGLKALMMMRCPITSLSGNDWSINDLEKLVLLEIRECNHLNHSEVARMLRLRKLETLRMDHGTVTLADLDLMLSSCPSIDFDHYWNYANFRIARPKRISSCEL